MRCNAMDDIRTAFGEEKKETMDKRVGRNEVRRVTKRSCKDGRIGSIRVRYARGEGEGSRMEEVVDE